MKTKQYKLFKMKHTKIIFKNEHSINELWNIFKQPNIFLIEEPEVQECFRINIWRSNDWHVPKLDEYDKNTHARIQQNPKHKNINKITSRYIIIKLQNQW